VTEGVIGSQIILVSRKLWSIYLQTKKKMTDLLKASQYNVGRGIGAEIIFISLKL
jgi:hypothetical protein